MKKDFNITMNVKILILLFIVVVIVSGCNTASRYQNRNLGEQVLTDNSEDSLVSDEYPSVTTNLRPSNPSVGEVFKLTISAEDDNGVEYLTWESSRKLSNFDQFDSFECGMRKSCSNTWDLSVNEEGKYEFIVSIVDSSGHEVNSILELNVQPFTGATGAVTNQSDQQEEARPFFTCGNDVCEGGESYESCSEDCDLTNIVGTSCGDGACEPGEDSDYCPRDCEVINPNCGNDVCDEGETRETCYADCESGSSEVSCNSNQDCDDEQVCRDGACIDVDCRTSADCSGCRRCSYNSCVKCAQGPYGCSC